VTGSKNTKGGKEKRDDESIKEVDSSYDWVFVLGARIAKKALSPPQPQKGGRGGKKLSL